MSRAGKNPVVLIIGTRPEGIKMIPLYYALKARGVPTVLCSTMQHGQLLNDIFDLFGVKPDIDLGIMRMDQNLFYLTQAILQKTKELFTTITPSVVVVQGDTTSAMAAALAAFYLHIPVCHVEAGLRTDDIHNPFPEEMNRRFITTIATYHYTPTLMAKNNVLQEGVPAERIMHSGNTVVDALRIIRTKIKHQEIAITAALENVVDACLARKQKIIVLTMHRRESFNGSLEKVLHAIKQFLQQHPDVFCVYSYHPNPAVIEALHRVGMSTLPNILVTEPYLYHDFVYLLSAASWVMTDSGGIQEEALSLGKPILVLRQVTERQEGVSAGFAQLVGTDPDAINAGMQRCLEQCDTFQPEQSVYGDGYAAEKIAAHIEQLLVGHRYQPATKLDYFDDVYHESENIYAKVCVVGLGYIGLPTAIIAAEHGYTVIGFDIDKERVAKIQYGDPVIKEPDIFEKLQTVLHNGMFRATSGIAAADYFIVAVPTPCTEQKSADLSYVWQAVDSIATVLKPGDVVIIESTIPVGTTQKIAQFLHDTTGFIVGTDIFVAHCPERVLPGKIFYELTHNARIIGGIDTLSATKAEFFYKQFVQAQMYCTDATTAELVKLVENSSRDVQLAFAHQVASMAYAAGLDPYKVIELANKHPRVTILNPSCGVGGHCIAVDPWFLVETFPEHTNLIQAAREVNDAKPHEIIVALRKAVEQWQQINTGICTIHLLGLTYKADVDDMRESPALLIARMMRAYQDVQITVSEPHITLDTVRELVGDCVMQPHQGIAQADIVVFLVAHKRFKALDVKLLKDKTVLDFCGLLYTPSTLQSSHATHARSHTSKEKVA